jgi:hypothetical protein
VATDAMAAHLLGFNAWDMEFLHLAAQRDLGIMDLARIDARGDDPSGLRAMWGKPRGWYGRANREWLISPDAAAPLASWKRYTAPADTLNLARVGAAGAAVRVRAEGHRKAWLWLGIRGRATASLNGHAVLRESCDTRFRPGQFQAAVELKSGDNLLVFRVEPLAGQALLSAQLVGPRNDGDTVEGIVYHV